MERTNPTGADVKRALPILTPLNDFFWTAGKTGHITILRCNTCEHWLHPPLPICPQCLGRTLTPAPLSGMGTVEAFTVNHHSWTPGLEVPYAVVLVSLDECPHVRITSRLITEDVRKAAIGLRVKVAFEQQEDVWLPFFKPLEEPK